MYFFELSLAARRRTELDRISVFVVSYRSFSLFFGFSLASFLRKKNLFGEIHMNVGYSDDAFFFVSEV